MMKLAVSGATSRLAVYKCVVAAELAGVELSAVHVRKSAVKLSHRVPTLLGEVELFGEHAIVKFIGNQKLDDSVEGSDWVELDQLVASSTLEAASVARIEEKLKKRPANSEYLVSNAMGIADVCVGCTLNYAKSLGLPLGPVSSCWLEKLIGRHRAFSTGLRKADAISATVMFSHLDHKYEQLSSIFKVVEEACESAINTLPTLPEPQQALLSEGNKQIKNGCPAEYQLNNAMSLFKTLQAVDPTFKSPRDVASKLEAEIKKQSEVFGHVLEKTEIAGPGFINLYLAESYVSQRIKTILSDGGLKPPCMAKRTVGVDFSSPNVAKEMHVGHLRSTIIGEVICRILEFTGSEVKRINHIGDWGTQFGMLLTYMRHNHPNYLEQPPNISDLDAFYREARKAFDASDEFKEESRLEVVKLQQGDAQALAGWRQFLEISAKMLFQVYERLGVSFPDGLCGESFYNDRIPAVVEELTKKGLVKEEDGAKCIFTEAYQVPLFLVKRDGGYGYDSTDLAAIKYRIQELGLDWLIYVVDSGQSNHFNACFEAADRAGWVGGVRLDHVGFGVVQGQNKKRFKTREGTTVRLVDLLDEAKNRMVADLTQRQQEGRTPLQPEEIDEAAKKLGYSAVKYFDLKNSRERDYVFDYDAMLASDGDTAVYLIYSYARICNIQAKVEKETGRPIQEIINEAMPSFAVSRANNTEWDLAVALLRFPEALERTVDELRPHHLCKYVYELASTLAKFYTVNRVLVKKEGTETYMLDPKHGAHWLILLDAVKTSLASTFQLLAIEPLERV